MRYSTQVKSISYVKANAAEVMERLKQDREPLLITQNGQEQITVQVPCNLASPGTVSVTIRGTASTTVTGVQVNRVQPGIFETSEGPGQRRYAVLLRADGSYVNSTNPARRGDILRMFVTGLGAVGPAR